MIYLIHFDTRYKHSGHYLGYVPDGGLARRMAKHKNGNGARLIQVIQSAGIGWKLVRVWSDGGRMEERKLKNCGGAARQCPICNPTKKEFLFKTRSKHLRDYCN